MFGGLHMRRGARPSLTGLLILTLTCAAPQTQASWSASIQDVMNLVFCLVGSGPCEGLEPGADLADPPSCEAAVAVATCAATGGAWDGAECAPTPDCFLVGLCGEDGYAAEEGIGAYLGLSCASHCTETLPEVFCLGGQILYSANDNPHPWLDDTCAPTDEPAPYTAFLASVDVTSDNAGVCAEAGGTWSPSEASCAPAEDCFRRGLCGGPPSGESPFGACAGLPLDCLDECLLGQTYGAADLPLQSTLCP